MSLKKILSLSLGLVILATVAVLISTGTVGAQSLRLNSVAATPPTPSVPVSVVNTPLSVTGSVNASITNAALPVVGTVAVSSLPSVTLSGTSPVSLNTSEFVPLYVEPDAAAANNPYVSECISNGPISPSVLGSNDCFSFLQVFAGSRLVIEYASLWARVPAGTVVANAYVGIYEGSVGGTVPQAYLPITKTATDGVSDYYTASAPVRGYAVSTSSYPVGGVSCGIATTQASSSSTPFQFVCVVNGHTVPGI